MMSTLESSKCPLYNGVRYERVNCKTVRGQKEHWPERTECNHGATKEPVHRLKSHDFCHDFGTTGTTDDSVLDYYSDYSNPALDARTRFEVVHVALISSPLDLILKKRHRYP